MDESLYDEFGNYIGPELPDSDDESEESEEEDQEPDDDEVLYSTQQPTLLRMLCWHLAA